MPPSRVHRVHVRHRVNRLKWLDRTTGRVIRRIETHRCGELGHIDGVLRWAAHKGLLLLKVSPSEKGVHQLVATPTRGAVRPT